MIRSFIPLYMHSIPYTLRAVILAVPAFFFISLPTIVSAATYYINPSSGNDANVGTSTSVPWKTVNKANGVLVAGDTVNLMTGTYTGTTQRISPVNSGTAGARITYKANSGATVTFTNTNRFIQISGKSYITIQGPITFSRPTASWGYLTSGANHITITGNTFSNGNRAVNTGGLEYSGLLINGASPFNTFSNNTFVDWGATPDGGGDALRITDSSDHTLVENNTFLNAGHAGVNIEASHNVVRNNTFSNPLWRGLLMNWVENASWLGGVDLVNQFNVIEGNTFDSNNTEGIQLAAPKNIFRRNVFVDNRFNGIYFTGWGSSTAADSAPYGYGNRFYHNTFVANGATTGGARPGGVYSTNFGIPTVDLKNSQFKNNIFARNDNSNNQLTSALTPAGSYPASYYTTNYRIAGSCFSTQPKLNITSLNGSQTITSYQSSHPTVFSANDSAAPTFVNEAASNFHLQSGSGCIDRGVSLTTTASAGSGTNVSVADALYFSDGKGLVSGDQITIGSQTVNVTAVNYSTNILTITPSISWSSGAPIHYQTYSGTAPDVGAYEFVVAAPSLDYSLSSSGNITATQGSSGSNTIVATLSSGTAQSVSYSASGLPSGATASFSPTSCKPTCSTTVTINTTASTPTGSSTITITGSPLSKTTSFILTVVPSTTPPPTLTLTPSPATVSLTWSSANAASCTASANPTNSGWNGSKPLSGTQALSVSTVGTNTFTLSCTGVGGAVTKSASYSVSSPTVAMLTGTEESTPGTTRSARLARQVDQGAAPEDVTALQTSLSTVYPERLVTGYFGRLTANAFSLFQSLHGLPSVGRVGPMTLQKLNEVMGW